MVQPLETNSSMFLTFLRVPQKALTNSMKVISFLRGTYSSKGKTFYEECLNGGLSFLTFLTIPHFGGKKHG